MLSNNLSLKRILKDIKEITKSPIEGIGIVSLDNDPMKYIVNIRIMSGIYEGYCLQLLLTFSDNYPLKPPKILIYPGQPFDNDNNYHHHIFKDSKLDEDGCHFSKFCFDLLDNDFLNINNEYSGWNPSYTISSLLLQVQTFLSNPDMDESHLPDKYKIEELMKSMDFYSRKFVIKTEEGEIIKVHTWKNPYPEMYFKNSEDEKDNKNEEDNLINLENEKNKNMEIIKENLTCFISKLNYIDDNNLLLGYTIKKENFINYIPIPEIISYESFINQTLEKDEYLFKESPLPNFNNINNQFQNLDNNNNIFFNNNNLIHINFFNLNNMNFFEEDPLFNYSNIEVEQQYKSANNEFYNNWLPIYINEEHFTKNKISILNAFSIIKYGNSGIKEYDFEPEHIFEILPNILFEMIKKISKNKSLISSSFIICYFQYSLLYRKLFQNFKSAYRKYINNYLDKQLNNINFKNVCNLFFDVIQDIIKLFIVLFFANEDPNCKEMKKLYDYFKKTRNLLCLYLFKNRSGFKMNDPEAFIDDLFKHDIFYKIVDLISYNKNFLHYHNWEISKNSRKKIIQRMIDNFKDVYDICDYELQLKIDEILLNDLELINYFNLNKTILVHTYREKNKDNEFYEYYDMLLILFILKKKMNSKIFMDELEKNYGVYIDADNFIKEMNNLLKKPKNIEEYNTYFGNLDKKLLNDIIILQVYKKTKEKIFILNFEEDQKEEENFIEYCLNLNRISINLYQLFEDFEPFFKKRVTEEKNEENEKNEKSNNSSFYNKRIKLFKYKRDEKNENSENPVKKKKFKNKRNNNNNFKKENKKLYKNGFKKKYR